MSACDSQLHYCLSCRGCELYCIWVLSIYWVLYLLWLRHMRHLWKLKGEGCRLCGIVRIHSREDRMNACATQETNNFCSVFNFRIVVCTSTAVKKKKPLQSSRLYYAFSFTENDLNWSCATLTGNPRLDFISDSSVPHACSSLYSTTSHLSLIYWLVLSYSPLVHIYIQSDIQLSDIYSSWPLSESVNIVHTHTHTHTHGKSQMPCRNICQACTVNTLCEGCQNDANKMENLRNKSIL